MTTDNTQEHMHNGGEATSCAQWSAQTELDDRQHIKFNILVPFLTAITIKRQKEKGNRIKDTETAYYDFAVDLITAHTNKQIEAVLDRIENSPNGAYSGTQAHMMINDAIRAERNKLNMIDKPNN